MREYLFLIAIFLVEGCMFKYISSITKNAYLIKNNGKLYCGLMTLQFLLMSALRDYSVGADTLTYVIFFERMGYGAVFILRNQILQLSALLTGGYYKFPGGQRPSNMVIIMTLLTLFCLWKYDKLSEIRSDNNGVINAVLIGTLFLPFTQINGTYMRLCYYYYMFLMILISEILLLFPKKMEKCFHSLRLCRHDSIICTPWIAV